MHRSSAIREALQDFLDGDVAASDFLVGDEPGHDVKWLLGKLYHCTDILPAGYCEHLDLTHGSTYAQAVRTIKREPEHYLA